MPNYAHDENNNRIETLSKEQVYALLAEAIQQGQLPSVDEDTAFVTMVKSIIDGQAYKMAFCTQAQYNELEAQGQLQNNTLYYITDDETLSDIENFINDLAEYVDTFIEGAQPKLDLIGVTETTCTYGDYEKALILKTKTTGVAYLSKDGTSFKRILIEDDIVHLYRHDITWGSANGTFYIHFTLYTNNDAELTNLTLKNYLTLNKPINIGGVYTSSQNNLHYVAISLKVFEASGGVMRYQVMAVKTDEIATSNISSDETLDNTFSDTVTTLF